MKALRIEYRQQPAQRAATETGLAYQVPTHHVGRLQLTWPKLHIWGLYNEAGPPKEKRRTRILLHGGQRVSRIGRYAYPLSLD